MERDPQWRGRGRVALCAVTALCLMLGLAAEAGAERVPAGGGAQSLRFDSGSTAYPYTVYAPPKRRLRRPAPLVVVAHGCQTTALQQMHATLYNHLAARKGFVVLYPDASPADAAMPGPLRNCWSFFDPSEWHRGQSDAAAIAGMTRTVMAHRRIDPQRVYLVGMSAGGFMTSILSAAYPDLYAADVVMAGGAYADAFCLLSNKNTTPVDTSAQLAREEMGRRARVVPRMVVGGDADQAVPPACADKALEQGLRTNNLVLGPSQTGPLSLTPASVREVLNPGGYPSTVSTYRDPAGCMVGQRWLIHGMNHFWPGGSDDPRWANWTDPKGPSGARVSWRFFKRYTKRDTAMPCAVAKPRRTGRAGQ